MYKKRYSQMEAKALLKNIIISENGKNKVNFSVANAHIAYGYAGLHTSQFGVYVEFTFRQLYRPILYFSTQDNPFFFTWHPDNHPEVDVLQPRGHIEGTSFCPDNFYIHPKDLFTDGIKIMK